MKSQAAGFYGPPEQQCRHVWDALARCCHNWTGSEPNLAGTTEKLNEVDRLSHLGKCISSCGNISDEVPSRVNKARLAFTKLRHLRRRCDIW